MIDCFGCGQNIDESAITWKEGRGYHPECRNPATARQPLPCGCGKDIPSLVQQDIEARAQTGMKKYGERLKAFNGRSALWDAYQEVLDLAVYLRQKIEEER